MFSLLIDHFFFFFQWK